LKVRRKREKKERDPEGANGTKKIDFIA